MPYHGVQERRFNIYADKTIQRGIRCRNLHIYTCERCGAESAVLLAASEPFYCHGGETGPYCGALVSIEPTQQPSVA